MSLKDMKKDLIVDKALDLFLKDSIINVKIKDIAQELEIGEMTIYRYFKTKDNLVLHCAIKLQKKVFDKYFNFKNIEGNFNKMKAFYNNYLEVFNSNPEYLKFINEFDLIMSNKEYDGIEIYGDFFDNFKDIYMNIYLDGVKNNEIKEIADINTFYYASSKSLLELSKKEASNLDFLKQDHIIEKNKLIEELINIILFNLKK